MTLFLITFIAGVLTVLAPCILPLLPVIVGGSVSGGAPHKKRAVIIAASLGVSVIVFTLLLKASTLFINIPQSIWMHISGGIIIVFGILTLFPDAYARLSVVTKLNRDSNRALSRGYKKHSTLGDMIIGGALGPVFSTCSPAYFIVLATVLPHKPLTGFLYLLSYTIGLCLMLLFVSLVSQKIIVRLGGLDPKGIFMWTLGIIFILVGISVATGIDKRIEAGLLERGFFDVTKFEQQLLR